jgi:hypothetical protein
MIYPPVNSMKLKQTTMTSTQQQTSKRSVDEYGYPLYLDAENDPALWVECTDPWNLRGRLPMTPVWKETINGAAVYRQNDGTVLYAAPPNPPTPEAVARAQFVDKTYVWKESSKTTKPS